MTFFIEIGDSPFNLNSQNIISIIFDYSFLFYSTFTTLYVSIQYFKYAKLYKKTEKSYIQVLVLGITFIVTAIVSNLFYFFKLNLLSTIIFYMGIIIFFNAFIHKPELNIMLDDIFNKIFEIKEEIKVMDNKLELYNQFINLNEQNIITFQSNEIKKEFLLKLIKFHLNSSNVILLINPKGRSRRIIDDIEWDGKKNLLKIFEYSVNLDSFEVSNYNGHEINNNSIDLSILYEIISVGSESAGKGETKLVIIFDSLSELLNWFDFNKTYRFTKKVIEKLKDYPSRISSYFLINPASHDKKENSSMEILFDNVVNI